MPEIQPGSTGLSGEYFVAAELYRRGYLVAITIGNAKAIDILAQRNGKSFAIQVKAIFKKKNVGWPIMKDRIARSAYYIFVNINGDKLDASPDYFICTGKEAYGKVKQYSTRGIIDLTSLRSDEFINRWDKLS